MCGNGAPCYRTRTGKVSDIVFLVKKGLLLDFLVDFIEFIEIVDVFEILILFIVRAFAEVIVLIVDIIVIFLDIAAQAHCLGNLGFREDDFGYLGNLILDIRVGLTDIAMGNMLFNKGNHPGGGHGFISDIEIP